MERSTQASMFAGAVATVAVWAFEQVTHVVVPAVVVGAISTIVMGVVTHFVPDARSPV